MMSSPGITTKKETIMTELIKAENTGSLAVTGYTGSVASLTAELEHQKEEIQPVIDFYDRLVRGWHGRILRAELALKDPLNQSAGQQKVFLELRNVAKTELEKFLPILKEVQDVQEQLSDRIRDFDLMHFSGNTSAPASLTPEFKAAKEILHKADALIELRSQE